MDKKRILMVDDDDFWLQTVNLILGEHYELSLTSSPAEAVSLVKSSFFSLAILDQHISGEISGIDLFTQLRVIRQDLPAIILTGYAEVPDAVRSIKTGIYDYISKGDPDRVNDLKTSVDRALKEAAESDSVTALIHRGESATLEFKSSVRWDLRDNRHNKDLEKVVVKTAAAFLNSESGGVLLIGVDDNGKAIGLQNDYKTLKRQNRDGFENFLVTLLVNAYGKDAISLIRIDFHNMDGSDVCRVSLRPSPKPIYVPEPTGRELYIRAGNSTQRLSGQEAVEYHKTRWPAHLPGT